MFAALVLLFPLLSLPLALGAPAPDAIPPKAIPPTNSSKSILLSTNHRPIKLHNADGTANWTNINARRDHVKSRYGGYDGKTNVLRKRYTENAPTVADGTFYLDYVVGSPPQQMQALLDSGSDIVWMDGTGCKVSDGSACPGYVDQSGSNLYNPSASTSSAKTSTTIQQCYNSGCLNEVVYTDTVYVAYLGIGGFQIGVTQTQIPGFIAGNFGWPYKLTWNSWNYAAWQTGLIDHGIMGWYSSDVIYGGGGPGEMAIGALNTARYTGAINYVGLNTAVSYWQAPMDQVIVNGKVVATNVQTIFDTGTFGLGAPTSALPALYAAIPGSSMINGDPTHWQYPCNGALSISFKIAGVVWPIRIWSYGQVSAGSSMCVALIPSSQSSVWLIGNPAMAYWYTIFDMENARLGFAKLA